VQISYSNIACDSASKGSNIPFKPPVTKKPH
jgi:hypothetical protein